jgi:hypothetical protein
MVRVEQDPRLSLWTGRARARKAGGCRTIADSRAPGLFLTSAQDCFSLTPGLLFPYAVGFLEGAEGAFCAG